MDIPIGKGAKLPTRKKATQLKNDFENLAKRLHIKIKVIITNGKEPIGNGIGPCLEARDALWILKNDKRGPKNLKTKSLMMAGLMLEMAGKTLKGDGLKLAKKILESGDAYKKMVEIIKLQGKKITEPSKIKLGKFSYDVQSKRAGIVKEIDNKTISRIARIAGAPDDKGAGIYLYKHIGCEVKKGEKLFTIYYDSKDKFNYAKHALTKSNGFVVV